MELGMNVRGAGVLITKAALGLQPPVENWNRLFLELAEWPFADRNKAYWPNIFLLMETPNRNIWSWLVWNCAKL